MMKNLETYRAVIAISGLSGSGKSTYANALEELLPFKKIGHDEFSLICPDVQVQFARCLKDAVSAIFRLSSGEVESQEAKARPRVFTLTVHHQLDILRIFGASDSTIATAIVTVQSQTFPNLRSVLQWVGTDFLQTWLGKEVHAQALLSHLSRARSDFHDVVIVTDMRFAHELASLRAAFGDRLIHVHIVRDDQEVPDVKALHVSEHWCANLRARSCEADWVFFNNGFDMKSLYTDIMQMLIARCLHWPSRLV
jgi:energy-coupling factor transporter ATP-binding protein EcfA2